MKSEEVGAFDAILAPVAPVRTPAPESAPNPGRCCMADWRASREQVVHEHVASENRHDFGETVRTFCRPRYEIVPSGESHDGAEAVRRLLEETHSAFPDMKIEHRRVHHADEAVVVEATFHGTHRGAYRGLPPTLRRVEYAMCNVFVFEGDGLVCERLYFDRLLLLTQLGIATEPLSWRGRAQMVLNHPWTISRSFLRHLVRRRP